MDNNDCLGQLRIPNASLREFHFTGLDSIEPVLDAYLTATRTSWLRFGAPGNRDVSLFFLY